MRRFSLFLLAGVLGVGALPFATAQAADFVLENIRVRLPGGVVISVSDSPARPWWYDTRVVQYRRYTYDPRGRMYVVYDDRNPPPFRREWRDNGRHRGWRR